MGEVPRWKCIRGKTLVNQTQGTHCFRITQVPVKSCHLGCQQQALVHNCSRREGRHKKHCFVHDFGVANLIFYTTANYVEPSLKGVFVHHLRTAYKNLLNVWL